MGEVTDPALLAKLNGGSAPAAPRTPQPILTLPNPHQDLQDQINVQQLDNSNTQTGLAVQGNDRQNKQMDIQAANQLRQDYNQSADVKNYHAAMPLLSSAMQAGDDGQGDLSLIYAYAKMMDPTTGVRDGEMDNVGGTGAWATQTIAKLKGQLDGSGGRFSPEMRNGLIQEMIHKGRSFRQAYNLERQRYGDNSKAYGIDPTLVIGPDAADPFRADMEAYDKKRGLGPYAGKKQDQPGQTPAPDVPDAPFSQDPRFAGQAFNANGQPDPNGDYDAYGRVLPDHIVGGGSGSANGVTFDEAGNITSGWQGPGQGSYEQVLKDELHRQGKDDPTSAENWAMRAANGNLGGLSDEINGLHFGLSSLIDGQNPITAYKLGRDLERMRQQQNEMGQGLAGQVVEIAGSLPSAALVPMGEGVMGAAKAGAAIGGVQGFGAGDGLSDSVRSAVTGAGLGAAVGGGTQKFVEGAGGLIRDARSAATPSEAAQNYAAGQKYGLDLSIGDVSGKGPQMLERTLDAQPGAASTMNAPRAALTDQLTTATGNVADTFGSETSFRGLGEAAQTGAKGWVDRFNTVSSKAYDAIPIKPDTPAMVDNTRAALRDLTDVMSSNPALQDATQSAQLVKYRDALESGNLSWGDLKAFRSMIGEQAGDALFSDGTRKSQLRALYAALSKDMEKSAEQQGPAALRAFKRANDLYAAGQQRIEGAVTKLLGNDGANSPEAAAALLQRISKGGKSNSDLALLAEVRKTLKPDEWGQVANGLIRQAGQPAGSAGREFNPKTFIQTFADMAPEAKNLLFGGENKALRQNLEEYVKVVGRIAANDSTRNTSGSAFGLGGSLTLGAGSLVGSSVGGVPGAILGAVAGNALMKAGAKIWTNPGFIRWATGYEKMLAAAAKSGTVNEVAQSGQMKALLRLAVSNPSIGDAARNIERQIVQGLQSGPARIAAGGDQSQSGATPTSIPVPR